MRCSTAFKRYKHFLGDARPTVPAVGIRRRIDALATLGWTHPAIGERMGITGQAVQQARTRAWTHPDTVARFAAVYDQLWNTRPPTTTRGQRITVTRCLRLAAQRGYAPPLAWDDDTIDDPAAAPDLGARVRPKKLPPADDLLFLLDAGESKTTLARRFRVRESAIDQALHRDRKQAAA